MPQYYFHTRNSRFVRDERGEAFDDDRAARREALCVLGEILRDGNLDFWETRSFSIVVTDEAFRPVVTLTATASVGSTDEQDQVSAPTSGTPAPERQTQPRTCRR